MPQFYPVRSVVTTARSGCRRRVLVFGASQEGLVPALSVACFARSNRLGPRKQDGAWVKVGSHYVVIIT